MGKLIRMSLAKYGGVAPLGAVEVDHRRGWFTIDVEAIRANPPKDGPKPTQALQNVPVVVRDAKDVFPCVHRGARKGDTPCGGCGANRYVEVFECPIHEACTVSRPARDTRIARCSNCKDRSMAEEVAFASYKGKYLGQTCTIVGRGETTFPNEDLAKLEGPIIFLNDAVQLEKYAGNNPTFFTAQDKSMAVSQDGKPAVISGLKSVAFIPLGLGLAFQIRHHPVPNIGKVCWTIKSERSEEYLLDINRDELAMERRLYRPARAPTICSAIHLAWFFGCTHVRFIRCDGLPTGYAKDLENRSNSPEIPHQYPQTKLDAEAVCERLGLAYEYLGSPEAPDDRVKRSSNLATFSFTGTETDAVGRSELNERSLHSFMANLEGVDWPKSKIWVNIDHVPGGVGPEPTRLMLEKYFGQVVVNYQHEPDFGAALKWAIAQPDTEFFCHLEMDWLLEEPVSLDTILGILKGSSLSAINLRAYGFKQDDPRICLSPAIWRAADAKVMASRIQPGFNPEMQLRNKSFDNPMGGCADGFLGQQYPPDRNAIMIRDIGRDWAKQNGFARPKENRHFNTWVAT